MTQVQSATPGRNVVVVGTQWGDEGKGKLVDLLTEKSQGVVRFQGGHNAGHTLVINGVKTKPPKYYDAIFERESPLEFAEMISRREYDGYLLRHDNTDARLLVKETVKKAQLSFLKRGSI